MRLSTLVPDLLPSIDLLEMIHGTFCRFGMRSNDTIVSARGKLTMAMLQTPWKHESEDEKCKHQIIEFR